MTFSLADTNLKFQNLKENLQVWTRNFRSYSIFMQPKILQKILSSRLHTAYNFFLNFCLFNFCWKLI